MPLASLSKFKKAVKKIPRKIKPSPKKKRGRIKKGARGKIWVPALTQAKITEKRQYWNKVTMTKNESLFKEMQDKFDVLALKDKGKERCFMVSKIDAKSHKSKLIMPYPSGSCHTVIGGDSSNFCSKPRKYNMC